MDHTIYLLRDLMLDLIQDDKIQRFIQSSLLYPSRKELSMDHSIYLLVLTGENIGI